MSDLRDREDGRRDWWLAFVLLVVAMILGPWAWRWIWRAIRTLFGMP